MLKKYIEFMKRSPYPERILITYFIIAAINAVLTFIVWKKVGKTFDFEKIRREKHRRR